jgi:NAD(P)-dependent dehydrogenase (short-subunit alcohol dehydrogenase family)
MLSVHRQYARPGPERPFSPSRNSPTDAEASSTGRRGLLTQEPGGGPRRARRLVDEAVRAPGAVDVLTAVRATWAALPHLLERAPSTSATICSMNSFLFDPTVVENGAAEAAPVALSKSLSEEFGPLGVGDDGLVTTL